MRCPTVQFIQRFEHQDIMLTEQALRNVQPVVGVDPDQMCIERGVMNCPTWYLKVTSPPKIVPFPRHNLVKLVASSVSHLTESSSRDAELLLREQVTPRLLEHHCLDRDIQPPHLPKPREPIRYFW